MKKIIFTLLFLITSHSVAWANSKTITMVIIGEDADKNAIKRSSEIYKRVVTELQQSLINKNIYVVDEDMISARLGFIYTESRNKQDLIKALSIVNSTNDARVRSRFGVIFAIFPNTQVMSMTRKISVRIRGQIFDLRNQRALSSFELKSQNSLSLPKDTSICNELCLEEKIGDLSISLSSELGNTLINKFNDFNLKESNIDDSALSKNSNELLINTYTVGFQNIQKEKIKSAIEKISSDGKVEVELLKASEKERIYSVRAKKSLIEMESIVINALKKTGINEKNVVVKAQD